MPTRDHSRARGLLRCGKLPAETLARCLAAIPRADRRVVLWPDIGEDAAAISFGGSLLMAKTDPITFASDLIGWYAVNINANDIAACGAMPRWFMATILLPEGSRKRLAESVFEQTVKACRDLNVALVGGHTEVTSQVRRPVVVGCMLGEVSVGGLVRTGGARVGDAVVLTKGIAIEGTALLAREAAAYLRARGVGARTIRKARDLLFDPGISVVRDAQALMRGGGVTAMHDPTEGGLATGLRELAQASHLGMAIDLDAIPVLAECGEMSERLGLDPLGVVASGALLATVASGRVSAALRRLRRAGVPAAVIGEVRPRAEGLRLVAGGRRRRLPAFARDELARYFEERSSPRR